MAEWLSSWLAEQEDRGSIPGLATRIFRDWLSPASKSRYGWKIAKSTLILKTTNQPTNQLPELPKVVSGDFFFVNQSSFFLNNNADRHPSNRNTHQEYWFHLNYSSCLQNKQFWRYWVITHHVAHCPQMRHGVDLNTKIHCIYTQAGLQ